MKEIDPKSLIIGVLATALVFACTDSNNNNQKAGGVPSLVTEAHAATSEDDRGKWDKTQRWQITEFSEQQEKNGDTVGWEPIGAAGGLGLYVFRKRVK